METDFSSLITNSIGASPHPWQERVDEAVPSSSRQELGRFRCFYQGYPQIGTELRPALSVESDG